MITKEQYLTATKPTKKISVPVLGDVYIRLISEEEAIRASKLPDPESRDWMVLFAMADEAGNRVFEDGDIADVKSLPVKSIMSVFIEAVKYNGLGPDEEPEKN